MLEYEKKSITFETLGRLDYISQEELIKNLEHCQFGIGTPTVTVEGNKVVLEFAGGYENALGEEVEDCEYTFTLNSKNMYAGGSYVDYDTMLGLCVDINRQLFKDGLYTGQREIDLEIEAKNDLELYVSQEELSKLSKEEYDSYLENMKVSIMATNMANTCLKLSARDIDISNEIKDAAVTAIQLTAFAMIMLNPGTALAGAAAIVSGAVGVADGGIRISRGEVFEGATEIAFSVIDIGGGYIEFKKTEKEQKYLKR